MRHPLISVIIPTYNRANVIEMTLNALCERQSGELPEREIIVIDDGSTDHTMAVLKKIANNFQNIIIISQPNKKQGAARNAGMRIAKGRLFVFLGDDIVPEKDFLYQHWTHYLKYSTSTEAENRYAAIGRTTWHPSIKNTPFKEWINEWGLQFGFSLIKDPDNVPFNFFYTSNLAFSRNLYERLGGFNEAFIQYGWEDIELGYRYQQKGKMCLKYIPEAIGYHLHDLTVSSFCKRQFHVGYSAVLFYKIYPELSAFLKIKKIHSSIIVMKPLIHLITMLLAYCDEKGINTVPLLNNIMKFHYFLGMRKALSDL